MNEQHYKTLLAFGEASRSNWIGVFADRWPVFMRELHLLCKEYGQDFSNYLRLNYEPKHGTDHDKLTAHLWKLLSDKPNPDLYFIRIAGTIRELRDMIGATWIIGECIK